MNSIKKLALFGIIGMIAFSSCKKDDDNDVVITPTTKNINLNISGLEDLGANYIYEGWLIVDGAPVTAGTFSVDASGNLSKTSFEVSISDAEKASTYVLTIEPMPDSDPAPSKVHILAGDFNGSDANLSVGHGAALANDFSSSTGGYILATPTDDSSDNENSGVWWLDPSAGPGAGLSLPTLPEGWEYEGWAVIDGTPISTGKFTSLIAADGASPFSGPNQGPAFPGEDLLINAPAGVSFPTDLAGKTVVISVEPMPDNSPAPFTLKPLVGPVPSDATDHTFYNMNNNSAATNPSGTVSK